MSRWAHSSESSTSSIDCAGRLIACRESSRGYVGAPVYPIPDPIRRGHPSTCTAPSPFRPYWPRPARTAPWQTPHSAAKTRSLNCQTTSFSSAMNSCISFNKKTKKNQSLVLFVTSVTMVISSQWLHHPMLLLHQSEIEQNIIYTTNKNPPFVTRRWKVELFVSKQKTLLPHTVSLIFFYNTNWISRAKLSLIWKQKSNKTVKQ